jgi:thioredoxin reductase
MKEAHALIVGSSAAGFAAAITARRHYPDASLALIR